jgi:hypothetical protein
VDDDKLDRFRPQLFANCLDFCGKKLKTHKTREAVLQCIFQPTCKGFLRCLRPIPEDP